MKGESRQVGACGRQRPSGAGRTGPRAVRAREKKRAAQKQASAGRKGEGRKEEKGRAAGPPAG